MSDTQPHSQRRTHRLPGNRVVRKSLMPHETFTIERPKPVKRDRNPAAVLASGFVGMILIGAVLLSLPFASEARETTNPMDALFTATSAVCLTGLVVLETQSHWSTFGEVVILALIQLGSLGFVTSSTLLLLLMGRRTSLRDRLMLGQSIGGGQPGEIMYLVRRIGITTLVIEAVGALLLLPHFLSNGSPTGEAMWWSVFHSVSAFNNAGFDLFGGFRSLRDFQHDPWLLSVLAILIVLGGISFVVMADVYRVRRWRRLAIDTKMVLITSIMLFIAGAAMVLMMEGNNPLTLGPMSWGDRIVNAGFFSITPRSAGYTQFNLADLRDHTLFFTMPLMFIGASTGSTGGGIKLQTFSLLFFTIMAAIQGRDSVAAFGREIANTYVYRALTIALLAIALIFGVAGALTLIEPTRFLDLLFESVSAFGTVGLSTGLTPELSTPSRIIIMVVMFVGRLGPLTMALALSQRQARRSLRYANESVRIG